MMPLAFVTFAVAMLLSLGKITNGLELGWELPVVGLISACGLLLARRISTFLKGLAVYLGCWHILAIAMAMAQIFGFLPDWIAPYAPTPASAMLPGLLVAFVVGISYWPLVRTATDLIDPYFETTEAGEISIPLLGRFHAPERQIGFGLLYVILTINVAQVLMTVLLNQWNNRFYNAIQEKQAAVFWSELSYFSVIAFIFMITAVYELYITQYLEIRWRRWLTTNLFTRWLHNDVHYRMRFSGHSADNPDQRISDDVRAFVERILYYSVRFFNAILSLYAFVQILWGLSKSFSYTIGGYDLVSIPGYLVWAVLLYALMGTWVTHLIGRPLVGINFMRQKTEADFRFSLVRVRENGEQIALLNGEKAEASVLSRQFGAFVRVWYDYMRYTKRLTWFTAFYGQFSVIFPFILLAPAYFSGAVKFGDMMQTVSAFSRVQASMSLFVDIYASLADLKSVIDRLTGFKAAARTAERDPTPAIRSAAMGEQLILRDVTVMLADGTKLVSAPALTIKKGERVLVTGPSGSGKSTLFRAIAGIWPYGTGEITQPQDASVLLLPQRPYLPIGTLREALNYPSLGSTYRDDELNAVLAAVNLPKLVGRLDEEGSWHLSLSTGEQQRLAIARALLHRPDWLFLDEATSAMDEAGEAMLYALIRKELPRTTLVSIGHRSTLVNFHDKRIALSPNSDGLFEAAPAPLMLLGK